MKIVIDCNVLIAANTRTANAGPQCAAACARLLLRATREDLILEDTSDFIMAEYKRYCNFSGQPGPGDRFFYWFVRNRWTPWKVMRVDIGADEEAIKDHLPASLHNFDRSDHKWVATYINGEGEALYNALDSDWIEYADLLSEAGIQVIELCPQDIKTEGRTSAGIRKE